MALQHFAQFAQVLGAMLRQVDRVQAEGGVETVLGVGQVPDPLPVALEHAEQHLALYAQGAAARQHLAAVGIEFREVQVVVGIDQHARQHIPATAMEHAPCLGAQPVFPGASALPRGMAQA
ncbi:hypothetical protein D3C85_1545890 [compost metagenome]